MANASSANIPVALRQKIIRLASSMRPQEISRHLKSKGLVVNALTVKKVFDEYIESLILPIHRGKTRREICDEISTKLSVPVEEPYLNLILRGLVKQGRIRASDLKVERVKYKNNPVSRKMTGVKFKPEKVSRVKDKSGQSWRDNKWRIPNFPKRKPK